MDGLSSAASIIAVIQLTQDVYKLCQDYVFAVKDARRDIELLTGEVMALHDILEILDEWVQGTDPCKFGILSKIQKPSGGPLEICQKELEGIKDTLERFQSTTGNGCQTGMKRVGMRALKWPFSGRELKARVDALSKGKDTLNLALTAESTVATVRIQETLASLTISVDSAIKEVSKEKVLGWLENTSPVSNHQAAVSKHENSTGGWLLQNGKFEEWRANTGKLFWLHGIPGSGKTILVSTMIESLKASITSANSSKLNGSVVVYYYFDFTDPLKQSSSNFLRSILAQVAREKLEAYDVVSQLYARCKTGQEQPNIHDLLASFSESVAAFRDVYLVIDAVDETPRDQQREGLLMVINDLCKCTNLHIAAASREEIDIVTSFRSLGAIEIEVAGSGIDSDIKDYVSGQLLNDKKLKKFPTQLKDEAQKILADKANGIVDAGFREHTLRSLTWIAFAQRPLTVAEVAESAVLDLEEDEPFDPDDRLLGPLNDILELLGSLVILQQSEATDEEASLEPEPSKDVVVKIAHFTVKEYLTTRWKLANGQDIGATPEGANFFLSKGCLRYVLFALHCVDESLNVDKDEFPLFQYATTFWSKHAKALPTLLNRQLEELKMAILKEPDPLDQWRHVYCDVLSIDSTQLHYAAHHDCLKLVQELVGHGVDLTVRNAQGITTVHLAAKEGHEEVVRVFMENIGPQLEALAIIPSPLYYACREGHLGVCEAILKHLTPMLSWEQKPYSPLHIAAEKNHLPIARTLIQYRVPATTRDFYGRTALHSLVNVRPSDTSYSSDRIAFAEYLIYNGVDVNTPDDCGVIPLHIVALGGDTVMAKYLISQCSLVHTTTFPTTRIQTPLHYACSTDSVNVDMIELLLENGAIINFPDQDLCTALSLACKAGKEEAAAKNAKTLLRHGADVNTREKNGDTPLSYSLQGQYVKIKLAEFLIENGADINARSNTGRTVLHNLRLWEEQSAEIVVLLLRYGVDVDVNAKDNEGSTPLLSVLKTHDFQDLVLSLDDDSQESNAQNDDFRGRNDKIKAVKLLLDNGADVRIKNNLGKSPLDVVVKSPTYSQGKTGRAIKSALMLSLERWRTPKCEEEYKSE